jgi:hypothetical protein
MKTNIFLLFAAIFATVPLGAMAQGLRWRRKSPLIDISLGRVRQTVDAYDNLMIKRNRIEEDENIIDEQEVSTSLTVLDHLFTTAMFVSHCFRSIVPSVWKLVLDVV